MAPFMAFGGFGHAGHMTPVFAQSNHTTATSTSSVLKISGVDGPTSLAVDQEGTWTVNVKDDGSQQSLHYSVKWGDEGSMMRAAAVSSVSTTSATFTHSYDAKGTYQPTFTVTDDQGHTVSKSAAKVHVGQNDVAHITSLSPGSGVAGTMVTLIGTGFASSTAVHFGDTTVASTSVRDTNEITFAVPSDAKPGTFKIWVKGNDSNQGRSNVVKFTVTAAPKAHLSVNGIDAPASLSVNQEGTWTVHAATNASGNLHYSVVWGDENMFARAMSAVMPQSVQTSATFTHSYDTAGTYQPKFTITDDSGHSTSASATVRVTDDQ